MHRSGAERSSIRSRTIIDHKFRFNLSAIKVTTRTSRRQEKKCPIHEKQSQLQTTSCRPNEKSEAAAKFALKGIDIPARIQVEEKSLWKFARLFFPQRLAEGKERNGAQKTQHSAIGLELRYATCLNLIRLSLRSTHCHLKKTPALSSPLNLPVPRRSLFSF
jgi:hypothetical protein